MLIKFRKQIGKSLAKTINAKVNQNPVKNLRSSVFCKFFLGLQGNSESCQTSKMEKIVKNEKSFTSFVITSISDVWEGSEYASALASKVTDVSFLRQLYIKGNR